jgi:hypothetical protein
MAMPLHQDNFDVKAEGRLYFASEGQRNEH